MTENEQREPVPNGEATVLIVDDKPENLLAMESILADLDQNLVRAGSAKEALRFLLNNDVALILLDVQMPGVNGFELAELIRERERTQHTPIIFVSAMSHNEQFVFKGYSLGAVDYLTKPFEPEILRSKVRFFTKLFRQNQKIIGQSLLLEESNSKLDELNVELESRVAERTAELENANKELEHQVAVRKRSEERLSTEHGITKMLSEAPDAETAFSPILRVFCDNLGASVACLWVPSDDGRELRCSHLETSRSAVGLNPFVEETRRTTMAKGVGLPGHVWEKLAPVWLPNTVRGNNFPRAAIAAAAGIHSALGFPIMVGREFFGMIEFFTQKPFLSDQSLVNMLDAIGSEIGQFIRRKQAETDREHLLVREKNLREQAEQASRLKDEFLATVSHELRTPLNAILGWSEMLNTGKLDDTRKTDALATIYRNAKTQAQLIDDLLDTSRLVTGNLRLNLSPTSVTSVIEAALDIVRPAAEAKGIKFSTALAPPAEMITCDSQRLQQMTWNLLTNAVKFTPSGGEISVSAENRNGGMLITVADTGRGIEPHFLPYVFDRFRQADSSSTRSHDGLGLGLAIVRHLAELHGGAVKVESDGLDKGSRFTVFLPVTMAEPGKAAGKLPSAGNGRAVPEHVAAVPSGIRGVKLLVVDDDADACELIGFALRQQGAEVRTMRSVGLAIEELRVWVPDILLTDINMPEADGYDFISAVRSMESSAVAQIPAIAVTAMARPEDTQKALSAGFQSHISKPIDFEELIALIARLLPKQAEALPT